MKMKISALRRRHNERRSADSRIMPENGMRYVVCPTLKAFVTLLAS